MKSESLTESEEHENRVSAARQRIENGYTLPPLPVAKVKWDGAYADFVNECIDVVRQRKDDHEAIQSPDEMLTRCSDAVIALTISLVARDVDIVVCYHQLILESRMPQSIRGCAKVLRNLYPGVKASGLITHAHVEAVSSIREAVWEGERSNTVSPVEVDAVIDDLTLVGLENLDSLDTITDLIRGGMFNPDRLRMALDSLNDSGGTLLEGVL